MGSWIPQWDTVLGVILVERVRITCHFVKADGCHFRKEDKHATSTVINSLLGANREDKLKSGVVILRSVVKTGINIFECKISACCVHIVTLFCYIFVFVCCILVHFKLKWEIRFNTSKTEAAGIFQIWWSPAGLQCAEMEHKCILLLISTLFFVAEDRF